MDKNSVDQPVRNYLRTFDNIQKTKTGQGNHYTTSYLVN